MKKSTLFLAVLFTLSGCAEINQPLGALSGKLKDLGGKLKHEDKVAESKPAADQKNTPSLATAEQLTTKSDARPTETNPEPAKKPVPLITSIPKEVANDAPQQVLIKPKPAEVSAPAPLTPPKTALTKDVKPAALSEHISLAELSSHNWQINKILVNNNFKANDDHWLFSFTKTGQYKAFGACNYLSGKFNAGDDGAFRLGKLETSLNDCSDDKDEEVMVFNMLLMADSFAMREDMLILKSGDKVMMELKPSNQDINVKMAHKSHGKKDKKTKAGKKKASKTTAQKPEKIQKADKSVAKKSPHKSHSKKK